jgi:hypothetical protein
MSEMSQFRQLTVTELDFLDELIADANQVIADAESLIGLGVDVGQIRAARDWMGGVRSERTVLRRDEVIYPGTAGITRRLP